MQACQNNFWRANEELNQDASMPQQLLRHFGLRWITLQECKKWFKEHKESKYSHEYLVDREFLASKFPHIVDRLHTLGLVSVFYDSSKCNLNMVREFLANWDQQYRGRQIKEEVVDYRPRYDPKGIDVTKIQDPDGIHGPVLSISEHHERIDNMLSHLYGMQMLQLRMNGVTEEVGPGLEKPQDDDATDEEQARVDSNLESDDDEDYSEMGEATLAPTDDED
ncbi:hypothetical protein HAX54_027513 [Datura stramonium]|uniref:Uncharacterized protein n=1 Tax=Datura stramonium TaxID=4076 RepID=A0ABS8S8U5_DATST|nr:hypothetical protein [Datura stramonium]